MADAYDLKKITDFTSKASAENADLFLIGDNGTASLRRITFDAIASTLRSMYGLNDLQRDIVGAGPFDLDNISDGWHQIDATSQPSNMPLNVNTGIIFQSSNTRSNGSKYQLYAYTNGTQMWQRVYWYGAWTAWKMISGKLNMSVTVGNGDVMTLANNTSTQTGDYMYVNCGIRFNGNRASGTLLARLPNTVSATQYLIVSKTNAGAFYMTNIAAGTGDIACPTSFASGDIAIITGVVRY